MNKHYARKLYGTKLTDRRAGHTYLLSTNLDDHGNMTEKTPAVIHCRNSKQFVADVEQFRAETGSTVAFPQFVQAAVAYELEKSPSRAHKFRSLRKEDTEATKEALAEMFGTVEIADTLARTAVEANIRRRSLKTIGPRAGRSYPYGLFRCSPAQIAAEALGLVSYVDESGNRLKATEVTLPRGACPVARGSGSKAGLRPSAKPALLDDTAIMGLLVSAVQGVAVDAILWHADVSSRGGYRAKGAIRYVSRFYASLLAQEVIAAGLLPRLHTDFKAAMGSPSWYLRKHALEAFWLHSVGADEVPSRSFNGLVKGFAGWLADVVTDMLKIPREEMLAAGVPDDLANTVLVFPGHFVDKTVRWTFSVYSKTRKAMEAVLSAHTVAPRPSKSVMPPMVFPPLPYVGECGGQVIVRPSKGRTNWLIKHSCKGIKQERQRSVKGAPAEFLEAISNAAAVVVDKADLPIAYQFDLDKL